MDSFVTSASRSVVTPLVSDEIEPSQCIIESIEDYPEMVATRYDSEDCMKAEIIWCLITVMNHYSFKSSDRLTHFKLMFQDSVIAKHFKCGESKTRCISTFGLADYCREVLWDDLKNQKFVLLLDESLNQKLQQKQICVLIVVCVCLMFVK